MFFKIIFEHVRTFQAHCDILPVFFAKKIGQEYPAFRQEFPRVIKIKPVDKFKHVGNDFGEIVGM